jgi:GNAT superfamily N-acetyltransferase
MNISFRPARVEDVPALNSLIGLSARTLCRPEYTDAQIEAALRGAWGVDTQLITDETYFVAEADGQIVGCGGWSRRQTLFGSDHQPGRSPAELDPRTDAARIRAFFVHPDAARRGIGTALLELSESEARKHGFRTAELAATLSGWNLYRRHGYVETERRSYEVDGVSLPLIFMTKALR